MFPEIRFGVLRGSVRMSRWRGPDRGGPPDTVELPGGYRGGSLRSRQSGPDVLSAARAADHRRAEARSGAEVSVGRTGHLRPIPVAV